VRWRVCYSDVFQDVDQVATEFRGESAGGCTSLRIALDGRERCLTRGWADLGSREPERTLGNAGVSNRRSKVH
jgi:hypothetical protein